MITLVVHVGWQGLIEIGSSTIGLIRDIKVEITNNMDAVKLFGTRKIDQNVEGHMDATGTISKGFIDSEMLAYAVGTNVLSGAILSKFDLFVSPVGTSGGGAGPLHLKIHGVKLNGISVSVPQDDFIMEDVDFVSEYAEYVST